MKNCVYIYDGTVYDEVDFRNLLRKDLLTFVYQIPNVSEIENLLDPMFEFMKEDERSWINTVFRKTYPPHMHRRVKFLYTVVNSKNFANWSKAGITLYKNAAKGSAYHEAWHEFSQLFLTQQEKLSLYREAITNIKELNGLSINSLKDLRKIEEYLADDFMNYQLSNGTQILKSRFIRNKTFRSILNFLKGLFGIKKDDSVFTNRLNELYFNLRNGELNNYVFSEDNVLFNELNRIINIKEFDELELVERNKADVIQAVMSYFDAEIGIYARHNNLSIPSLFNSREHQTRAYQQIYINLTDPDILSDIETQYTPETFKLWKTLAKRKVFEEFQKAHYNKGTFFISSFLQKQTDENIITETTDVIRENAINDFVADSQLDVLENLKQTMADNDDIQNDFDPEVVKKRDDTWNLSGNEFNSMDTADVQIRFMVKSLLKMEAVENEKGEIENVAVPNHYGFYELVDFESTWNMLVSELKGLLSYEEMYSKLEELTQINPSLINLLEQLPHPNKDMYSTDEKFLIQRFRTDLGRYATPIYVIDVDVDRNMAQQDNQIKSFKLNLRRSSSLALNAIKSKMQNQWLQNAERSDNKFVLDFKGEKYLKISEIIHTFMYSNPKVSDKGKSVFQGTKEMIDNTTGEKVQITTPLEKPLFENESITDLKKSDRDFYFNNRLAFFEALGFYFSDTTKNSKTFIDFIENEAFMNGIGNYLMDASRQIFQYNFLQNKLVTEDNESYMIRIDNPLFYFAKPHFSKTTDGKFDMILKGENNKINEFLNFEKINSGIHYGEMAYAADLKTQFEASEYNTLFVYNAVLNNYKKYPTYQDLIKDYPFFNEDNDPYKRGSLHLHSLFNLDVDKSSELYGQRFRDNSNTALRNEDRPFVKIDILNYSGLSLTENRSSVFQGKKITEAAPLDRILMNVKTILEDGFTEILRTSDKSMAYATQIKFKQVNRRNKGSKKTYFDIKSLLTEGIYLDMTNPSNYLDGEFRNLNFVFKNYLVSELERIYKVLKLKKTNKYQILDTNNVTEEFKLFEKFLSPEKKESLKKDIQNLVDLEMVEGDLELTSFEELKEHFNGFVGSIENGDEFLTDDILIGIGSYLEKMSTDWLESIYKKGFEPGKLNKIVTTSTLYEATDMEIARAYTLNHFVTNVEDSKLFFGDPVFFKEYFHRLPLYTSTGKMPDSSQSFINGMNNDPNFHLQRKLRGLDSLIFDGKINTVTLDDVQEEVDPEILDKYIEHFNNTLRTPELIKDQMNDLRKEFGKNEQNENPITETDGQGISSFNFYRLLKISIGHWYDQHEQGYIKIIKHAELKKELENLDKNDPYRKKLEDELEELKQDINKNMHLFPPVKLGYGGPLVNNDFYLPGYDKFAIYPIIPGLYPEGSNMENLAEKMLNENVDYIAFSSARKTVKLGENQKLQSLYTDNKTRNINKNPFFITQTYLQFYKEQLQIEPEEKEEDTFGSQFRKLIFSNKFENEVPMDFITDDLENRETIWKEMSDEDKRNNSEIYRLSEKYNGTLQAIVDNELDILLEQIGATAIYENGDLQSITIENHQALVDIILKEAIKKKAPDSLEHFLILEKSGKLKYPIEASKDKTIIKDIFLSIINNRLIKQKINGQALVQVAQTGFEFKFEGKQYSEKLKHYDIFTNEKGVKILPMEVEVSFNTNYKSLLKLKHPKDNYPIKTVERLNEAMRDEKWYSEHSEKFEMVGYRIPTQAYNSMAYMKIKQFLPKETQNLIVLPSAITKIAGSDFDIDKMSIIRPFFNSKGEMLRSTGAIMTRKEYKEEIDSLSKKIEKLRDKKEDLIEKYPTVLNRIASNQKLNKTELTTFFYNYYRILGQNKHYQKELERFELLAVTLKESDSTVRKDIYAKINKFTKQLEESQEEIEDLELLYNKVLSKYKLEDKNEFSKESYLWSQQFKQLQKLYDTRSEYLEQVYYKKQALNNEILEIGKSLLSRGDSLFNMIYPNSVALLKGESKNIEKWLINKGNDTLMEKSSGTDIFNPVYINQVYEAFMKSGDALGIAALAAPQTQIFQKVGAYLSNVYEYNDKTYDTVILLNTNKQIIDNVEYHDLSAQYDSDNKIQKSELFSQYISAYVDSQKDPFMITLNGVMKVAPVLMYMAHTGVPIKQAIYLVNQYSVRKYIENLEKTESIINNVLVEQSGSHYTKLHAIAEVWNEHTTFVKPFEFNNKGGIKGLVEINEFTNRISKRNDSALYGQIEKMLTKQFKEEALDLLTESSLQNNLENELDAEVSDKINMFALMQFIMLENQAQALREVSNQLKFDTHLNESVGYARYQKEKLENTIYGTNSKPILPQHIVEKISTSTEVSPFNVQNVIVQLFEDLLQVESNPKIQLILKNLLNDKKLKSQGYVKRRIQKEFSNDIMMYIIQNLDNKINWNAVKEGDENIGERFIKLMAKYNGENDLPNLAEHSEILNNVAITNGYRTDFKSLKWIGENLRAESIDKLSSEWRSMAKLKDFPDIAEFFQDLVSAIYISYGENRSRKSFFNIVPSELYAKLMIPYLDAFLEETRKENSNFLDVMYDNFPQLFKDNNAQLFNGRHEIKNEQRFKQYRLNEQEEFDPILIETESVEEEEIEINEEVFTQFRDMGKFTRLSKATGTSADLMMRKRADGFIGEAIEKISSTTTSADRIAKRKANLTGKENLLPSKEGKTIYVTPIKNISDPIIMLARNYSLNETDLENSTKQLILDAINISNPLFILGNSSVDRAFVNYLNEINYSKYEVYAFTKGGGKDRITEDELIEFKEQPKKSVVFNEIKGTIPLKVVREEVIAGTATSTVRGDAWHRENYNGDGVYNTDKDDLKVDLVYMGKVRLSVPNVVGDGISYTMDEFAAMEGFGDWDNFTENAKYAGKSLVNGGEVHLYKVNPTKSKRNFNFPIQVTLKDKNKLFRIEETGEVFNDVTGKKATTQERMKVLIKQAATEGFMTQFKYGEEDAVAVIINAKTSNPQYKIVSLSGKELVKENTTEYKQLIANNEKLRNLYKKYC